MGTNIGLGGGNVPEAVAAYIAQNGLGQPTSGPSLTGNTGIPGAAGGQPGLITALQGALKGGNPVNAPVDYKPWGGPVEGGWGQEFDRLHRFSPQKGDLMPGSGPWNPATGESPPGGWSIENHGPIGSGGGSAPVFPTTGGPINTGGYTPPPYTPPIGGGGGGGGSSGGGGGGYTPPVTGGGGGSTSGGGTGAGTGGKPVVRPGGGNSGKGGVYGGNAFSSDWTKTPGSQDLGPPAGWSSGVQGYAMNSMGYDPNSGWVLPSAWSNATDVTRSGFDETNPVASLAMQYAKNYATPEAPRTDLPASNPGETLYDYAKRVGFPSAQMGSLGMAVGNMPADMSYGEKLDRVLNPRGYMTDAELANDRAATNIILKSYPRDDRPWVPKTNL